MAFRTGRPVWALDLVLPAHSPSDVRFVQGRLEALPFRGGSLDAVAFHFVLLWLPDPHRVLREVRRILRPGGVVMILSEPDLTRREDRPDTGLGAFLSRAVRCGGGHPEAGRLLPSWLSKAGFRHSLRETPPEWVPVRDAGEILGEIRFLRESGVLEPLEAEDLERSERAAAGTRLVRLPLAYGCAWKD